MGMDWLRGLVGSSDQMVPPGQQAPGAWGQPPGQQPYGAPPAGGYAPPQGGYAPPTGGYTPPQGEYSPPQGGYTPPQGGYTPPQAPASGDPRVAELQGKCDQLRKDVDAIALFARTLLALLEEKQVVTEAQFQEARKKLDLLDGKIDDR
jgi:hypothetical protein